MTTYYTRTTDFTLGTKFRSQDLNAEFDAIETSVAAMAADVDDAALTVTTAGSNTTSTTSNTIGTGSKTWTVQTGKSIVVGMTYKMARTSAPTNWMIGTVTAYDTSTGSLTLSVALTNGSGSSLTDWTGSVTGYITSSTSGYRAVTSSTTISLSDLGALINATSGTFTISIDSAATLGAFFCYVQNSGSGTITLDPSGAETIDSATTAIVAPGKAILLHCDGTSAFRTFFFAPQTTLTTTSISADLTLTSASAKAQSISSSVVGRAVILPDATTLRVGDQYTIRNTGALPVGVRSNGNTLVGVCAGSGTVTAMLLSTSSAAGTWNVSGDGYRAGMVTLDNTFSSTYTTGYHYGADLGGGLSVHVIGLAANGFAAYCVDSTGRTVGTPLSISTVSGATPRGIYTVSSTTAVIFWSESTDTKCAVVTATGTSLAVGATATLSGASILAGQTVSGVQHIAALSATLYLVSESSSTTLFSAAMEISGTTCTWGSRVDTAVTNIVASSVQLYRLSSTAALCGYLVGSGAPYANTVRVLSVSGTAVTANSAATVTGVENAAGSLVCNVCALSSTLAMVADTGNTTTTIKAASITISGTSVTANTAITVEGSLAAVGFNQAHSSNAWAQNPPLRALTSTTAVLVYHSYNSTDYVSRAVVLSDSGGTLTTGTIQDGTIFHRASAAVTGSGYVIPGDATNLPSAIVTTSGTGLARLMNYLNHSISGTTITPGQSIPSRIPLADLDSVLAGVRLSSGDCILVSRSNLSPPQAEVIRFANGGVGHRGVIDLPWMSANAVRAVVDYWGSIAYSNGTMLVGQATQQTGSTAATRIARLEVAA